MSDDIAIQRGSTNVFADLGYTDADTHLLKAGLVTRIREILAAEGLTQAQVAERTGVSQPDISRLLRGQFRDVSVERLMRMLTKLGCGIDVTIRGQGEGAKVDTIHLEPA